MTYPLVDQIDFTLSNCLFVFLPFTASTVGYTRAGFDFLMVDTGARVTLDVGAGSIDVGSCQVKDSTVMLLMF